MPKRYSGSLDTNVLLRLLLDDIESQSRAAEKIVAKATEPLLVADIAIAEIVFVLERHYKFTRRQIADTVIGLIDIPKIACNGQLHTSALQLFVDHAALSYEDCCLASYAEHHHAEPLWTFDRKLANQARAAKLIK